MKRIGKVTDHELFLGTSGVTRYFFGRGGGGSTNSVEDRGEREWGSGGGSPWSGVLEAAVIWYKNFHFMW